MKFISSLAISTRIEIFEMTLDQFAWNTYIYIYLCVSMYSYLFVYIIGEWMHRNRDPNTNCIREIELSIFSVEWIWSNRLECIAENVSVKLQYVSIIWRKLRVLYKIIIHTDNHDWLLYYWMLLFSRLNCIAILMEYTNN